MKYCFFFVFALVAACVHADPDPCQPYTVEVNDTDSFNAALKNVTAGATILLEPGVYVGPFHVRAWTPSCPVTIASKDYGTAVLTGSGGNAITFPSCCDVTLKNVDICKGGTWVSGSTLVTFENVSFHDIEDHAVSIWDSTSCYFRGCRFSSIKGPGHNCFNIGFGNLQSYNNDIRNCTFGDDLDDVPIFLYPAAVQTRIVQNVFRGQGCKSQWMIDTKGTKSSVINNTFVSVDNTKLSGGIYAEGDHTLYQGNVFDINLNTYGIVSKGYEDNICASNKVIRGAGLTDGSVDPSC